MSQETNKLEPMLYLCATPIGNLGDITLRVIETLKAVDAVYCEDTRRSGELMNYLSIKKPLIACHEHNERARGEEIANRVLNGDAVAFISDAGMPGISDPGEALVSACIAHGAPYTLLPGASAPLTALVLSGFPTKNACFAGFLPREGKERRLAIASLAKHGGTLIFYESPLRIAATAEELSQNLGDRPAALVRELTKRYEQVVIKTLSQLAEIYKDEPPKGECVLVVKGADDNIEDKPSPEELAEKLIKKGVSVKDAAKEISALCDIPRNMAYDLVNRLKAEIMD